LAPCAIVHCRAASLLLLVRTSAADRKSLPDVDLLARDIDELLAGHAALADRSGALASPAGWA